MPVMEVMFFSFSGNIICFLLHEPKDDDDTDAGDCSVSVFFLLRQYHLLLNRCFNFFRQHHLLPCLLKEPEDDNDAGERNVNILSFSGNIICFLVFSKNQKMDLKPSFINILRCLAVFDTLFLVNLLFQFRLDIYCKSLFWFEIYFFKVFLLQHISICAMFVNTPLGTIKVSTGIYYVQCDQL